jgi:hypothetical protein
MPTKTTIARARSVEQAIAIGLSTAREAGVRVPPRHSWKRSKRSRNLSS